jgi:hypothetical protein
VPLTAPPVGGAVGPVLQHDAGVEEFLPDAVGFANSSLSAAFVASTGMFSVESSLSV